MNKFPQSGHRLKLEYLEMNLDISRNRLVRRMRSLHDDKPLELLRDNNNYQYNFAQLCFGELDTQRQPLSSEQALMTMTHSVSLETNARRRTLRKPGILRLAGVKRPEWAAHLPDTYFRDLYDQYLHVEQSLDVPEDQLTQDIKQTVSAEPHRSVLLLGVSIMRHFLGEEFAAREAYLRQ